MAKHFHIMANKGDIAETVLLPGDPLRAKFIAENFLQNPVCYNEVRGMYGYTGLYKGKKVSVQGTGMGMPSHSIYVNELISEYGAQQLIRIGSCGATTEKIKLRDIIIATGATSNSNLNNLRFPGYNYAAVPSFELMKKAYDVAHELNIDVVMGQILSSDLFYDDTIYTPDIKRLSEYGILAVEMETAELYTLTAKHGVKGLSILTVSDVIPTGEQTSPEDRQTSFTDMMKIALSLA